MTTACLCSSFASSWKVVCLPDWQRQQCSRGNKTSPSMVWRAWQQWRHCNNLITSQKSFYGKQKGWKTSSEDTNDHTKSNYQWLALISHDLPTRTINLVAVSYSDNSVFRLELVNIVSMLNNRKQDKRFMFSQGCNFRILSN